MLSPLYSGLCYRRYIDETFDYNANPQLEVKHWVWPSSVPLWERKRLWVIEPATATMLGNSSADPCTRKRNIGTFYGPLSNMWSTLAPQPNQLVSRTMANISLLTPSSVAGVAVRINDERNMYLAEVRTRNITLVRIVGGLRTVLAVRPLNYTMEGGAWGRIGISAQARVICVTQTDPTPGSNVTAMIINITDSAPLPTPGGSALYLAPDSLVRYDNFATDIGCDLGNVVRWAHTGMQILFSCKPGFTPVGNLTWTCIDGVQNYGSNFLMCLSQVGHAPPPPPPICWATTRTRCLLKASSTSTAAWHTPALSWCAATSPTGTCALWRASRPSRARVATGAMRRIAARRPTSAAPPATSATSAARATASSVRHGIRLPPARAQFIANG